MGKMVNLDDVLLLLDALGSLAAECSSATGRPCSSEETVEAARNALGAVRLGKPLSETLEEWRVMYRINVTPPPDPARSLQPPMDLPANPAPGAAVRKRRSPHPPQRQRV